MLKLTRKNTWNQPLVNYNKSKHRCRIYGLISINGVLEFVHSLTEGFTSLEKTLGPIPALLTAVFAAMTVKNAAKAGLDFLSNGGLTTVVG